MEMRDRDLGRDPRQISSEIPSPSMETDVSGPVTPLNASLADGMGQLSITEDHAVYTGSSHWVTILEDVRLYRSDDIP